jgi:hypothetical protein
LNRLSYALNQLSRRLASWWWDGTSTAWKRAWGEPARELRIIYLLFGLVLSAFLVPSAFNDIGFAGGLSYLFALSVALSNATLFRIVRVGRADYIPLGLVAPFAILIGIIGSGAIRPLLGDAKNAALAGDLIGAIVVLAVFAALWLWFREWQSGNPYK